MFWDLLILLVALGTLLTGYIRGMVKVAPGFVSGPLSLFAFAASIPAFLGLLLPTPLFTIYSPKLGWAVLIALGLLLFAVSMAGRLLGKGAAKLLDLFLADEAYRVMGALVSGLGLWFMLNGLHLILVRVFPNWAPAPHTSFQEWVLLLSLKLTGS